MFLPPARWSTEPGTEEEEQQEEMETVRIERGEGGQQREGERREGQREGDNREGWERGNIR